MKLNLLLLSAAALVNAATATDPVDLGTAVEYAVLTKSGISTASPDSAIIGNIAVSPIAATAITGFELSKELDEDFSTSPLFEGYHAFAPEYSLAVKTQLTTAISDMELAYTDAAGRPSEDGKVNLGAGIISNMDLSPGVYTWGTDIKINSGELKLTGSGSLDDIFILRTTGSLLQADNTLVTLVDVPANQVFWQVAEKVEVGEASTMQGILLVKEDALFKTDATLNGRVFAQTACNLIEATITQSE